MSPASVALGVGLSLAACSLAAFLWVLLVWQIDRHEREPRSLLVAAFVWGAAPAIVIAAVGGLLLSLPVETLWAAQADLVGAAVIAPLVEEPAKALALLGIYGLARHEFDGVLDGVVYGATVGFGFAMTENLLYFSNAWISEGPAAWTLVVLGRAVAFGFAHAMFTALTGVGLGLACFQPRRRRRYPLILAGLGAAIGVHLLHNLFLSLDGLCLGSLLADWLGLAVVAAIVVLTWQREHKAIEQHLLPEVASGVLTPEQYETTLSWRRRLARDLSLIGNAQLHQVALWHHLVDDAIRLALKNLQLAHRGPAPALTRAAADLRHRIAETRRQMGDPDALHSRPCSACGRPSSTPQAAFCRHCGASIARKGL